MSSFDDLACSADVGRINPIKEEVIEPTHACPLITNNYVPLKHKTVSIKQCMTRIEVNARCIHKCKIAQSIKEKMK